MRIAILHFTAPPVAGGVERIVGEQARVLLDHGHKVKLVAGRGRSTRSVEVDRIPLLASTDRHILAVSDDLARGIVSRRYESIRAELRRALSATLSRAEVVIVHNAFTLHFNLPLTSALADLAGRRFSGRMVAWTHDIAAVNPLYADELHEGYPWDLMSAPTRGVHYVAISESRRTELENLWRRSSATAPPPVAVIPNGIDPTEVLSIPRSLERAIDLGRIYTASPVLLAPVRITRRKRLELAIQATEVLIRRGLDPLLLVTGPIWGHHPKRSNEYLSEIRGLSEMLGVGDRVFFVSAELGRPLRQSELSALYRLAGVLVFPSESEGFGLPLLEAGLARLPVVATDLPVVRELARGNAWTFDTGATPERIADKIEEAMGGDVFRRRILNEHTWDSEYTQRILPLLQSLIHG